MGCDSAIELIGAVAAGAAEEAIEAIEPIEPIDDPAGTPAITGCCGWACRRPASSFGMMSAARGLVYLSTGAVAVYSLPDSFALLGEGSIDSIPIPLIVLVVVAVLAYFLLTRTRLGRHTYAIGSNPEAARLSGISIAFTLIVIYVLQGLLAGFGGMIASSRVVSGQPNFGIGLELDVIAATVIGGASLFGGQGTIIGTLIGAFLIAVIRNGAVLLNINEFYQEVIIGGVIWLAVYWDQFRRRRLSSVS